MKVLLTRHAYFRAMQRKIPEYFLDVILGYKGKVFIAQGKDENDKLVNYRIVKTRHGYFWVGIEQDGFLITVIKVDNLNWIRNRVMNYKHMSKSIRKLGQHRERGNMQPFEGM